MLRLRMLTEVGLSCPRVANHFPAQAASQKNGVKERLQLQRHLLALASAPVNGSSCSSLHFLFCPTPRSVTRGTWGAWGDPPDNSLGSLQSLFMGSRCVVPYVFLLPFLLFVRYEFTQPRLAVDPCYFLSIKFYFLFKLPPLLIFLFP